ncbi:ABC transporter permease [Natrinema thermotolerans]|uniref:ABC transporter permease n=1 Tax=Natrinema thermotolerans TaxID=121872 RepID=A0AAF0T246_9EURY|nr:ABC transporter permease [Natrinema thermotolerans]QCC57625.1 ABC transporter permease [Natrinema thermotolerans]WMT08703.1 ABC transporter permease [Natrinema thermotolerans]
MSRNGDPGRDRDSEPRGPNPPQADGEADTGSSRRARWAVARRELGSLRSEKTIILALAIQLFIAAFSSFLVVGLVSLYDPGAVDSYELDVAVTGDDTETLLSVANERDGVTARQFDDRGAAYEAFDAGSVSAVLDANRNDDGRLSVRVTAPEEGIRTTLLVVQLRDTLQQVERVERQRNADAGRLERSPVPVPSEIEASPYVGFTYTILVPLLCFLPVFISGSIAVDSLIEERQRGTLELLRVAPLSLAEVVDAKLLAIAALAPVQAIAWLALLAVNGTAIAGPVALVALVAALSLLVVTGGVAVALWAPDRRQAQLLYSMATVGALVVATVLPEHPANTVAKFAIGNPTTTTWGLLAGYCLLAIAAFLALQRGVDRLEPESL